MLFQLQFLNTFVSVHYSLCLNLFDVLSLGTKNPEVSKEKFSW